MIWFLYLLGLILIIMNFNYIKLNKNTYVIDILNVSVTDEKGTVIRDSSQVAEGQTLKITPSKGVIEVIVK